MQISKTAGNVPRTEYGREWLRTARGLISAPWRVLAPYARPHRLVRRPAPFSANSSAISKHGKSVYLHTLFSALRYSPASLELACASPAISRALGVISQQRD